MRRSNRLKGNLPEIIPSNEKEKKARPKKRPPELKIDSSHAKRQRPPELQIDSSTARSPHLDEGKEEKTPPTTAHLYEEKEPKTPPTARIFEEKEPSTLPSPRLEMFGQTVNFYQASTASSSESKASTASASPAFAEIITKLNENIAAEMKLHSEASFTAEFINPIEHYVNLCDKLLTVLKTFKHEALTDGQIIMLVRLYSEFNQETLTSETFKQQSFPLITQLMAQTKYPILGIQMKEEDDSSDSDYVLSPSP